VRPEINYYRDAKGNQIDLSIREKVKLIPVGIISGPTDSSDFVNGLERSPALVAGRVAAGAVL